MINSLLNKKSINQLDTVKVKQGRFVNFTDSVSVEEPLEIRILFGSTGNKTEKNISITMRTPGNDVELAIGFLFTEGIINSYKEIKTVKSTEEGTPLLQENRVIVELSDGYNPEIGNSDRNFYTTSSCGVCGKSSIQAIKTVNKYQNIKKKSLKINTEIFYALAEVLKKTQSNFEITGGIHASAIFDLEGNLNAMREDVGRHNALDKLIGYFLINNHLPLNDKILLLSGRASFELIQKASMAGVSLIASIGAPSSLAVSIAKEFDMTLIGFLKKDSMNIYHKSLKHSFY
ncbi:formate dehydrogenase accessory sulfurtransferase FdhD [Apibacter muscae]|uniref:Sulfur carrier protein FdhD n=1 Tax=Apibacter muscae TaxID=2509004 RepID=A0A563DHZ7_9FLAO|nr:formate dehydrogenase accessory sulfurtransferase FdhD [Apibacter muscae]TWP24658.1 formate dehydrogenase accessory sulfurtransferase FdhD [Apibacter muscae]TWP29712.1 formate dehydrogenase accessory sulfurtransferase FdhD [Apibacter muscae]TWP30858.1 formate dehydrogenase accessory sulfurtransferase FdhD [Apibacter muscae]